MKELDIFATRYNHATISPTLLDFSNNFPSSKPKLWKNKGIVLGYFAQNGPVFAKYTRKGDIIPHFKNTPEIIVLSCLCLKAIQNTSLSEIWERLKTKKQSDSVCGFKKKDVQELLEEYSIDPENDQVFFFANTSEKKAYQQAILNRYWFSEILKHGSTMPEQMSELEYRLMEPFYEHLIDTTLSYNIIAPHSYMYGREIHTPQSVVFLQKKLQAIKRTFL